MSLTKWFNEKWVDISTTEGGKHPPCGRRMGDKRAYPKCVPQAKASSMTKSQKTAAVRRKRATNPSGGGQKPTYART